MSTEYNNRYELDEDNLITLDWGGVRPVTAFAPDSGQHYILSSALSAIPLDKPAEPVLRWLLEKNMPTADADGISFAIVEDAVFLTRNEWVGPIADIDAFKQRLADFLQRVAGLDNELNEFLLSLSEIPDSAPPPVQPQTANATADIPAGNLSPEELLRAKFQQMNMRF